VLHCAPSGVTCHRQQEHRKRSFSSTLTNAVGGRCFTLHLPRYLSTAAGATNDRAFSSGILKDSKSTQQSLLLINLSRRQQEHAAVAPSHQSSSKMAGARSDCSPLPSVLRTARAASDRSFLSIHPNNGKSSQRSLLLVKLCQRQQEHVAIAPSHHLPARCDERQVPRTAPSTIVCLVIRLRQNFCETG
jgi:hypothetical protein